MKTSTTTFALFFALLFAGILGHAQPLQHEMNWLQTWKNFAGSQSSATWISNEIANGAFLYTDPSTGAIVLQSKIDGNTLEQLETALEEGIQAGNGNQMLAAGASEVIYHTAAVNSWNGLLGGCQVYATVVAQLQDDREATLVMRLSRTPLHDDHVVRNQNAIATLAALGSQGLSSPLVSEAK